MADNSIVKYAILAGGAYLLWQSGILSKLTGTAPAAPPATPPATPPTTPPTTGGGGSTSAPPAVTTPPPGTQYTPPTTKAQLLAAVKGNSFYIQQGSKFNADQWKYYYDGLPGNAGKLDPYFDQLFFPSGRPTDPAAYPTFTVDDFLTAIGTQGLSGLAAITPAPVANLMHRAAAGDLVAAMQLTRLGVKIPVGGRHVSPAELMRSRARVGVHGVSLGGLPISVFRV